MMLAALAEAQATGARLRAACAVIGISARIIERWRRRPHEADRRRGPRRRPGRHRPTFDELDRLERLATVRDRQQFENSEVVGAFLGATAPAPNDPEKPKAATPLRASGFRDSRGGTRTLDPGIMSAVL